MAKTYRSDSKHGRDRLKSVKRKRRHANNESRQARRERAALYR